jgi:hypothetical protein
LSDEEIPNASPIDQAEKVVGWFQGRMGLGRTRWERRHHGDT